MRIFWPLACGTVVNAGWIAVLDWANGSPYPPPEWTLSGITAIVSYPTGSWVLTYAMGWAVYVLFLAVFNRRRRPSRGSR